MSATRYVSRADLAAFNLHLGERITSARAAIKKAWQATDTRMLKENLAVALMTLDGEEITFNSLRARMEAMP